MNRKIKDLQFFELGKVYFKKGASSFAERRNLSIGMTGQVHDGWIGQGRAITLFDLKGAIESLFSALGIEEFSMRGARDNTFSATACSAIEIKGEPVGLIGEIDKKALNNFDIKDKVYAAEIDCEALIKFVSLKKYFKELPRYPSISRDISIVVDSGVLNSDIVSSIKENAGGLLKEVNLIDRYLGGQIPDGKVGLTYRLEYQDSARTLEDKDVQGTHSRVIHALENNLAARLR